MSIASRLNRLQRHVSEAPCAVCGGTPRVHRVSAIYNDDPEPSFPGPVAAEHCACGRRITYMHIRNFYESLRDGPRDGQPDFITGPAALVQPIVGAGALQTARRCGSRVSVPVGASAEAEA